LAHGKSSKSKYQAEYRHTDPLCCRHDWLSPARRLPSKVEMSWGNRYESTTFGALKTLIQIISIFLLCLTVAASEMIANVRLPGRVGHQTRVRVIGIWQLGRWIGGRLLTAESGGVFPVFNYR
jgi:hypothetical protein